MIYVDGERGRKRLHVTKKALRLAREGGAASKIGMFEGFTYKVWRDGDLEGGWVVAPDGIFIVLSDQAHGIRQFVCDAVGLPALPITGEDRSFSSLLPLPLAEDVAERRYYTGARPVPLELAQYYGDEIKSVEFSPRVNSPFVETERPGFKAAVPLVMPLGGEYVLLNVNYLRSSFHNVAVSQVTHCYDVAKNAEGGDSAVHVFYAKPTAEDPPRRGVITVWPGMYDTVTWQSDRPFTDTSTRTGRLVDYTYQYIPQHIWGAMVVNVADVYDPVLPQYLALKLRVPDGETQPIVDLRQFGAYYSRVRYEGNTIRGVTAIALALVEGDPYDQSVNTATSDDVEKWSVSLAFVDMVLGHSVVASDVLAAKLDAMHDAEFSGYIPANPEQYVTSVHIKRAITLGRLFGWPHDTYVSRALWNTLAPVVYGDRDTVTFSDKHGNVYSWVRRCLPDAGIQFNTANGFNRIPLSVPDEVLLTSGLRPRMALMTFDTYWCAPDTAEGVVTGFYVGSPFVGWEHIAFPDGVTMYAVRCVIPSDSVSDVGLVAIGKIIDQSGDAVYGVYLRLNESSGWSHLSRIPIDSVDDAVASWDVCAFGNGALAHGTMSVVQPPPPQQHAMPELR